MTGRAGGVVRFRENCFVRAAPGARGRALGVVKRGEALPLAGKGMAGGWMAVEYRGRVGWAAMRFADVGAEALDKAAADE